MRNQTRPPDDSSESKAESPPEDILEGEPESPPGGTLGIEQESNLESFLQDEQESSPGSSFGDELENSLEIIPEDELKDNLEIIPEDELEDTTGSDLDGKLEESPKKKAKKNSAFKELLYLVLKLAAVALILWAALTYVFGVFRLSGNNMYPMLKDGDLCVTYRLEEYHSGDVVAYRIDGCIHFGRVIARAGDTVDGDERGVLINGMYPSEEIFYPTQMLDTGLALPVMLGEGQLLILNDYRGDLSDSRTYGVIHEDDLEGKIIFIFRRRGF